MFKVLKWDKNEIGDKLTKLVLSHRLRPKYLNQCDVIYSAENPRKWKQTSNATAPKKITQSVDKKNAKLCDDAKVLHGQASSRKRKKNLKESRRRKRKIVASQTAEVDESDDAPEQNTSIASKKKRKLSSDVHIVQKNDKDDKTPKLFFSNLKDTADPYVDKNGTPKKNNIAKTMNKNHKRSENDVVEKKRLKKKDVCDIPKKSKRNKYFHMTEAYKAINTNKTGDKNDRNSIKDKPKLDEVMDGDSKEKNVLPKLKKHSHVKNMPNSSNKLSVNKSNISSDTVDTNSAKKKKQKLKQKASAKLFSNLEALTSVPQTEDSVINKDSDHSSNDEKILENVNDFENFTSYGIKTPNSLTEKMESQLKGAHFRYINEQLYSCSGKEAFDLFNEDVSLFHTYHHGYEGQVARWPVNPLDLIIKSIKRMSNSTVVADFGCGTAKLARNVKQKVYSFDLVALNSCVTACDMSQVPVTDETVDVAVFCLSLMGTNIADYIREANRVLKKNGLLKIAEVASRITKLHPFVKTMARLGFTINKKDTSNNMFILLDFIKTSSPKATQIQFTLPPCVYKPR